jgi:hypothetical protein
MQRYVNSNINRSNPRRKDILCDPIVDAWNTSVQITENEKTIELQVHGIIDKCVLQLRLCLVKQQSSREFPHKDNNATQSKACEHS